MDLKLARLRELRINMESNADLHIDLNSAEDLDLGNLTFAGSDEGEDLSEFLQERVGNYDYLDLDEEDLKTIPSPDVDASADSQVEEIFLGDYQKHARGDGAGSRIPVEHQEHLRESRGARGPDPDIVLVEARKAMTAGIRGDDLLKHLASKFDKSHLLSAAKELKSFVVDQHLLGNVILEPELFASCQEMEAFLKGHKVLPTAKFAKLCSSCQECPSRRKAHCQKFDTTLVDSMPDSPRVFAYYAGKLQQSGKIPTRVIRAAQGQAKDSREATAALFAWTETLQPRRKEVQSVVQSVAVPERREVSQNPREAMVQIVGRMLDGGVRLDKIKNVTMSYLGSTPFERVARAALVGRGSVAWSSFGLCDHPLLMDRQAGFYLEAGENCGDCKHNYGDHCHLNQRAFTESFVDSSRYEETPGLISEDEQVFLGSYPELDLSPSIPSTPALEASDVGGLDEGFEV